MKFGRWTVISREGKKASCKCECGTMRSVAFADLKRGHTKSCGCLAKDKGRMFSKHPLYATWINMIHRCYNENHKDFPYYGGRGIRVRRKWKNDFSIFARDMGERPVGTTLDRVNNELGYGPGNCQWASRKQQANNRRPKGTCR